MRKWAARLVLAFVLLAMQPAAGAAGLEEATILDLQRAFASKRLSAEALVKHYLRRIERYDKRGPKINALIALNPKTLEEARRLDQERRRSGPRSLLHGVPVIIKDNMDLRGMPTTGGSRALARSRARRDAEVVRRLRAAGAVILGKANMSELAWSAGWLGYSSAGGQSRNPYRLTRNPSGSSAGTAAAIAAAYAQLGTGTDTAGSVRMPAAACGLVGIKPTLGLIGRDGVIPLALSLDVVGPMARSVTDAAIALHIMARPDVPKARKGRGGSKRRRHYQEALKPSALRGERLGIIRDFNGGHPAIASAMGRVEEKLEMLGARCRVVRLPRWIRQRSGKIIQVMVDFEFRPQLEGYLATLSAQDGASVPRTLGRLIALSEAPPAGAARVVNPGRIAAYRRAARASRNEGRYWRILRVTVPRIKRQLRALMARHGLDALVLPTGSCPPSGLHGSSKPDRTYVCHSEDPFIPGYLANITGWPEVTIPMEMTRHGLPLGVSFLGRPFDEARLLGFAFAYEQSTRRRTPPATTPPLSGEPVDLGRVRGRRIRPQTESGGR